jgi:hypothetical protein
LEFGDRNQKRAADRTPMKHRQKDQDFQQEQTDKGEIRSRRMKGLNHEIHETHENERTKNAILIDTNLR